MKAQDKIVGVCAVDASARKSGGTVVSVKNCRDKGILRLAKTVDPVVRRPCVRSLTVKSAARPKYVRVRNSAGDWSRWLKLRG